MHHRQTISVCDEMVHQTGFDVHSNVPSSREMELRLKKVGMRRDGGRGLG